MVLLMSIGRVSLKPMFQASVLQEVDDITGHKKNSKQVLFAPEVGHFSARRRGPVEAA